jgi:ring-1,2-phenylacetyl-CoA epoxidase subunit PaaA
LEARNKAWDDGKWVRDGMLAHADKKRAAKLAAE